MELLKIKSIVHLMDKGSRSQMRVLNRLQCISAPEHVSHSTHLTLAYAYFHFGLTCLISVSLASLLDSFLQ